jgi:hypothetical protein
MNSTTTITTITTDLSPVCPFLCPLSFERRAS